MSVDSENSLVISCNYCGRENKAEAFACSECGTPFKSDQLPQKKSKVLAIILALFLGPLGLLYASVPGAIAMFLLAIPAFFLSRFIDEGNLLFQFGMRLFCVVWAVVAVKEKNEPLEPQIDFETMLNEAARLETSDRNKALTAYEEIIRLYPDTPASSEAARNIQTLNR